MLALKCSKVSHEKVSTQIGQRNLKYMEKLQRRFLRMLSFKLGMIDCPLNLIEKYIGVTTLAKIQEAADVIFIYKIVNNMIDCLVRS